MYQLGERNSKIRKERRENSLLKHTPNDLESDLIHAFWQKQLQYHDPYDQLRKPENVVHMDATVLKTATIMQPQYRNRHHFMYVTSIYELHETNTDLVHLPLGSLVDSCSSKRLNSPSQPPLPSHTPDQPLYPSIRRLSRTPCQ